MSVVTKNVQLNGLTTFWSLCDHTPVGALSQGLEDIGRADLMPDLSRGTDALSRALHRAFSERRTLIRPLKGLTGYAVVLETPAELADEKMEYEEAFKVGCVVGKHLIFNPEDTEHKFMVEREFQKQLEIVPASKVGGMLTKAVRSLEGISMRPKGGMYWVPEKHLDTWNAIADVVHKASADNYVLGMTTIQDANSLETVCFSMTHQVERMLETLTNDLENGDLGKRALKSRERQAQELDDFLHTYEGVLGRSLSELRNRTGEVEEAAGIALLAAMGE